MGIAYHKVSDKSEGYQTVFGHYISPFVNDIYPKVPVMVKRDIELLLRDFSGMYITVLHLILREKFKHPLEMIAYLKELSTVDLLNLYLEGNETGCTTDSPREVLEPVLKDLSMSRHPKAKDADLFFEFLNYPLDIGTRFSHAMSVIYNDFFSKREASLDEELDQLMIRHQALYDEDPEAFINAILFQSKESLDDETSDIHVCLSCSYGAKVSVVYYEKQVYFFYGADAEQKLYSQNLTVKYEELIKSLGDETRRNLIKFLMHEPHYNKEISDHLGITTATISYHIGRLVDLGIIHHKYQEGKRIYYQVDQERFQQLFDGLSRYLMSKEY